MKSIFQRQVDSAGNVGWVLINVLDLKYEDVLNYLQGLAQDGHSYAAEESLDGGTQRIAEVIGGA